jgi:thiol-disulfide isomerase/thioredoxin
MQASLMTGASPDYKQAYNQAQETGQPLVVLVGADWCPGCQTMKNAVIPQLQRQGALSGVSFAMVNTGSDSDLAGRLMRGSSIPQLIMYYKTPNGWQRRQMIGAQSANEVASFISQGRGPSTSSLTQSN